MNKHLNIFRAFSQKEDKHIIEDNLSRALVLCLKHDYLFYHEFLKLVLHKDDYRHLFSHYNPDSQSTLDIQRDLSVISAREYHKIYAIALTDKSYDMMDFLTSYQYSRQKNYRPYTDIFIAINDILLVVEVKRSNEDCRQQLYNQLHQLYMEENENKVEIRKEKVIPRSFSWERFVEMAMHVSNFKQVAIGKSIFLNDFISLLQRFNSKWIPIQPLSILNNNSENDRLRYLRLETAINAASSDIPVLGHADRIGFDFEEPWASELLYWRGRDENNKKSLIISMWPGNTKGQGWSLYYKNNLKWRKKSHISIQGIEYPLVHEYHIKFTSFQKFFTGIDFDDSDLKTGNGICNAENFKNYSGRVKRKNWSRLEDFFDKAFAPEFAWKKHCLWKDKIIDSDKTQFDVSFGFRCYVNIPYQQVQDIDTEVKNGVGLNQFVIDAYRAFKELNK